MAKKAITAKKNPFEAPFDKRFWLNDGSVLASLKELANALEKMEESVWKHHVTKDKNDFANWIEGVFQDKKLGQAIRRSKTAKAAGKAVKGKVGTARLWTFF